MKTLEELINRDEPGIVLIKELLESAENNWELLPPSDQNETVLESMQVTTRSPMGAMVYDTGGLFIDNGWLRFIGSGHPKLSRNLASWNEGRTNEFCLVADDAVGGFFAINGGGLGDDLGMIYYWAPDSDEWEALEIGYTDFLQWTLSAQLTDFYQALRWDNWQTDIAGLSGDECFSFYPFLWTEQGTIEGSTRKVLSIREVFDLRLDIVRQLFDSNT